ncbi:dynamin family protein [Bacillus sp. FJAT-44742]|uniref:dynamin family protein n=1 Tax=Bacillus sp. FJAT-44742 TaxID=2014005 RepID=UPI000C24CDF2|nr:dynamin family protein [Bacillus sp. FJAT-44742]
MRTWKSALLSKQEVQTLLKQKSFNKQMLQEIGEELAEQWKAVGDTENSKKAERLLLKMKENKWKVAFCGHFSAGKSTMINHLLGKDLLPSHPIPTSANIVEIKKGDYEARVTFKEKSPVLLEDPTDLQAIKEYCKDGDEVTEVSIATPTTSIPENVIIMDTPGIDSTDKAHRLAAEAKLDEADLILYLMDYHHVESAENMAFIKELNERYMYPVAVISQIDKHNEAELSFKSFKKKVASTLARQSLVTSGTFFLSSFSPELEINEWKLLQEELSSRVENKEKDITQTAALGFYRLLEKHIAWEQSKAEEKEGLTFTWEKGVSSYSLNIELEKMEEKMKALPLLEDEMERELLRAFDHIFSNAKLTPYHTRNAARSYLESRQGSFKVRGLFSRRKTKSEQKERLEALTHSLQENVRAYIEIHLKQKLQDLLRVYRIDDIDIEQEIQNIDVPITSEVIRKAERKGALFTQDYVLTYCRLLVSEVRLLFKEALHPVIGRMKQNLEEQKKKEQESLKRQIVVTEEKRRMAAKAEEYQTAWRKRITSYIDRVSDIIEEATEEEKPSESAFKINAKEKRKGFSVNIGSMAEHDGSRSRLSETSGNLGEQVRWIEEGAGIISAFEGLTLIRKRLLERLERLKEDLFQVALFGAFSAGKSSFANTLLGGEYLPVSPNPTTASINHIRSPDDKNKNGTVLIMYKSEKDLLNDLNDILVFSETAVSSISEFLSLWQKRDMMLQRGKQQAEIEKDERNEKEEEKWEDPFTYLDGDWFEQLSLFAQSYETYKENLGKEKKTDLGTFQKAAAQEEHAMYIAETYFYLSCPLTNSGVTLTDTPGASSVYQRHTATAFEYMKNADALLFLTYYNHAFSKADEEFLIQLGRIKEFFRYDKMFFIVNASDLASSEEELTSVLKHVEDELITFGIRRPRILPVSSKSGLLGVKAKSGELSSAEEKWLNAHYPSVAKEQLLHYAGIEDFWHQFHGFRHQVMNETLIKECWDDIKFAKESLLRLRGEAFETIKQKKETLLTYQKKSEETIEKIRNMETDVYEKQLAQEIEELLFYVKQRVFYRYFDEFKKTFTPLQFSDEEDFKRRLRQLVNEFLRFFSHDLTQEIRATYIRLERFLNEQIKKAEAHIEKIGERIEPMLSGGDTKAEIPTYPVAKGLTVDGKTVLSLYEGYTSSYEFFIEKGNVEFKDKLEIALRPWVDDFIEDWKKTMIKELLPFLQGKIQGIKDEKIKELDFMANDKVKQLDKPVQTINIEDAIEKLTVIQNRELDAGVVSDGRL